MARRQPARSTSARSAGRGALIILFGLFALLVADAPSAARAASPPASRAAGQAAGQVGDPTAESKAEAAAALLASGRLDEAEELYLAWLGASPQAIEPYLGLLEVWSARGALERVPRLVVPAGRRWLESGRAETALRLLESAVAAAPDCRDCWGLLGRIRIELRDYLAAEEALERALAGDRP
ncbi:MAG: tetratricopeptide repeat protein, partial [Thermoanaerobaculia bacterium]|nr:tetratricopeptide repeat protein [Thermoanaerobaculia bacterium]